MIIDPLQKFLGATLGLTRDKRVVTNVTPGQHDGLVRNDGQFLGQTRPALWHPAGTLGGRFGTTEWSGNPWGFGTHGKPEEPYILPLLDEFGCSNFLVSLMITGNNEWFSYRFTDADNGVAQPGFSRTQFSDEQGDGWFRWQHIYNSRYVYDTPRAYCRFLCWPFFLALRKSLVSYYNELAPYCAVRLALLGYIMPDSTDIQSVYLLPTPYLIYSNVDVFTLSYTSFTRLAHEDIPEDVLNQLQPLSGQEFTDETLFLAEVATVLSPEQYASYARLIVRYATPIFAMQNATEKDVWADQSEGTLQFDDFQAGDAYHSWLASALTAPFTTATSVTTTLPFSDLGYVDYYSTDPVPAVSGWQYLWTPDPPEDSEVWVFQKIHTSKIYQDYHRDVTRQAVKTETLPIKILTAAWEFSDANFEFYDYSDDPWTTQYTRFTVLGGTIYGGWSTHDNHFTSPGQLQNPLIQPSALYARCSQKKIGYAIDTASRPYLDTQDALFRTTLLADIAEQHISPDGGQTGQVATFLSGWNTECEPFNWILGPPTSLIWGFRFDLSITFYAITAIQVTFPSATQCVIAMRRNTVTRTLTLTFTEEIVTASVGGLTNFDRTPINAGASSLPRQVLLYFNTDLIPTWTWTQHEYWWSDVVEFEEA